MAATGTATILSCMIYGLLHSLHTLHICTFLLTIICSIHDSRPTSIQSFASLHGRHSYKHYLALSFRHTRTILFYPQLYFHPFHSELFFPTDFVYPVPSLGVLEFSLTFSTTERQPRYPSALGTVSCHMVFNGRN
ncbi:hypothetical protein F5B21DRAFT_284183 [Xylaria acuta]|nr:hypothetical protein F5B21DRAFT_284183 [Xylaria acuta]